MLITKRYDIQILLKQPIQQNLACYLLLPHPITRDKMNNMKQFFWGAFRGLVLLFLFNPSMSRGNSDFLEKDYSGPAIQLIYTELSQALDSGNERGVDRVIEHFSHQTSYSLGLTAQADRSTKLAEKAFRQALNMNSDNARARLELGRILYEKGALTASEKQFEQVLTESNPPVEVKRNIETFMTQIQEARQRFQGGGQFTVGFLFDDNVNVGPKDMSIAINPFQILGGVVDSINVSSPSQPRDSWGLLTAGSLFGVHEIGHRGGWAAAGSFNYYQTHLNEAQDSEILFLGASGGFQHTSTDQRVELPISIEKYWRGGDELLDVVGVSPTWVLITSPSSFWRTVLDLEDRSYEDNEDRNSVYAEVSEEFRYFPKGAEGSYLSVGLGGFYAAAEEDIFTHYGLAPQAKWDMKLAQQLRFSLQVYGRYEEYEDREPLAPKDRNDRQFTLVTRLDKRWSSTLQSGVQYQFTRNNSTFDIYDFDRNVVYVDTTLSF